MNNSDFFNFEENICDFPFYNKEYPLSKLGLISFIIAFIIPIIIMFSNIKMGGHFDIMLLVLGITAIGIASHGDFTSICKRLKISDINLIFKMIILEIIFTLTISLIETIVFHVNINSNIINSSILTYIEVVIGLFGEELFVLIGFFIFTFILYKFTSNRNVSVSVAVFLSLSIFGLLHYPVYGNVLHSLVAIGYTSIFTIYTYLKTKNIFVSYLTHLIFDFIFIGLGVLYHADVTSYLLFLI